MAESQTKTLAATLAENIRSVADKAQNEEELRIGVEKLLEPALQQLGIEAHPRYERRILRTVLTAPGRADALYGQAIIEYEPPGKLSTGPGLASTVRQLEGYLRGLAGSGSQREAALRRMAGIGLDGRSIFFLRYRGDRPPVEEAVPKAQSTQLPLLVEEAPKGSFSLIGPYVVNEVSISEFLLHLRALRRRPMAPEALAEEFGPAPVDNVAHKMVNALYNRLEECLTAPGDAFPQVKTLYEEWKRIFGIVYGQELVKAQRDANALARLYHVTESTDLKPLLFAVHTYYALLMKLLAAELLSLQQGALMASIAEQLPAMPGEQLRSRLAEMEKGSWFEAQGIRNFLEADFFGWYVGAWNTDIEEAVRSFAKALADYEPATATLNPEATRDLLKKLYQYLVPRELRHDLGEYYTPDWLAELVLNDVGYTGDPTERLLDPACGSGTFLVLAIRRALDAKDSLTWRARGERELVAEITENIVGFDLNPLAVIASRTNYLLALGPLARHLAGKDIPVYLCDSILTPQTQRARERSIEHQKDIPVPSAQKEFWVPEELVDKGQVDALCRLLEQCVADKYQTEEFLALGQRKLKWEDPLTGRSLGELYEKVRRLEAEGRNGLWARIIKNAFAPVFRSVTPFDYVVGNPPWVNWESLADDYREATKELWQRYGLFSLRGHAARLGGGKKDVAMLMLYAAMDSYLKDGGKLGFVITQTVFKTKGAGDGFRRFRLGEDGPHLKVLSAQDVVELQPFEGASNRTATVILQKGEPTQYPVSYTVWEKAKPGRIEVDLSLEAVKERTRKTSLSARPVDSAKPTSPWLTASPAVLDALQKAIGPSFYQAHAGACTWVNGVYWLRVLDRQPNGLLVENLYEVGKTSLKKVPPTVVEPDLVYPLLRGRDISRWKATPSAYILMVQDPNKRTGYEESWLKVTYPHAYAYLKQFEDVLRQRSGYRKFFDPDKDAFYSMYNVGDYTFAPYKVVWREQASELTAAVTIDLSHAPVPDHKLMLVVCQSRNEAFYLAACLNSAPSRLLVQAYVVAIGMSTHVLENVAIPKYDPSNALHQSMASLSQRAHQLAAQGKTAEAELRQVEEKIDGVAAQLWGLTEQEMAEIRRGLEELA
ncbi:MAG: N-6 DNA methylase [bacterium]|nr:N-6 DNA methylase [bacterium]